MINSYSVAAMLTYISNMMAATFYLLPPYVFQFYNSLAHRLTRWECPRTQADFDNSYTFKVFLFQFANYYSSLFYVAFFKGVYVNLSQLPGTRDNDGT
ncbi:hypothetical protein OSTOST_09072 [Ostertagia ostertagi]